MKKVVITVSDFGNDMHDIYGILIEKGYNVVISPLDNTSDIDRIKNTVYGASHIIAGGEVWNKEVLKSTDSNLKMITRFGAGYDLIDIQAATQMGIAISNTPGANAKAVAEHALSLMLGLTRGIIRYDREIRSGKWKSVLTAGLTDKTIGLIGFGSIARELAKLLSVFSVKLLAYDTIKDDAAAKSLGVIYKDLDTLLSASDVVSLHLPLNKHTENYMDIDNFKKMKPTAFLINTSRGGIVCEDDIIFALENGIIAGAGLDVFKVQPIPSNSPLILLDNVILTPHAAYTSIDGLRNTMRAAVKNIIDFDSCNISSFILNPDYLYHINHSSSNNL